MMPPGGSDAKRVLAGGGEMGALMRTIDWAATPLGPVEQWPPALRTAVSTCLGSRFPILLWWGPQMVKLYNDAYRPMLGSKHPRSMGAPGADVWPEIWHVIGPMLEGVLARGEATWSENQLLYLDRHGFREEAYFTYSYSPIFDEAGAVGGVFSAVTETTRQVLGERRLRALHALAERTARAATAEHACRLAAEVLADGQADLPHVRLYLVDADGRRARLAAATGGAAAHPDAGDLALDDPAAARWGLAEVVRSRQPVEVAARPAGGAGDGRAGDGGALALPLVVPGDEGAAGVLVAGLSPHLRVDAAYRSFLDLVAGHVTTAMASARALETARQRAEALAELDRAKTSFFSNVSHELRTPLTLLLAPVEDLLAGARGPLARPVRDDLEAVHRNVLRLRKLVDSLLDFSRIEAGRAVAAYQPIDLAAATRELAGVFRSAIERAGLRLVVDCPPLSTPVHVDPTMWEKIVLNLLSNALKFTFEGEIRVSLRERGDVVELEVADTGTGVPAAELPRLFERFHRVQGARARSHEGTGIGLALVQELLRLHGGAIEVDSEVGRGTVFRATVRTGVGHLPRERLVPAPAPAPAPAAAGPTAFVEEALRWLPDPPAIDGEHEPPVAGTHAAGARVLVADDNADMRDYLRRILGRHWRVTAVADGLAALAEARRDPPELLLTDVMMPQLDGFGLLAALRADERTRHLPVVMLSARAGEEARIEGLEAGADDYLIKPFSARELVARIGSQLLLARSRRALADQRATLYSHFMQAPAPIAILRGPDHVVELANPACCQLWGRAEEELVGRPLFAALPELAAEGYPALVDGVLRDGRPYVGKEMPARRGAGERARTSYHNVVFAPLRDLRGEQGGVLALAFDVTEEVHARDELARTVKFNELLAGILAHDLRNPLAAISTGAEVLRMRQHGDDPKAEAMIARILSSSARMSRMIGQLLDFTRIRLAGGLRLDARAVDLGEVARSVVAELEGQAAGRRVELDILGDPVGRWDADRLAQAVSNLVANAAQHGAQGAPVRVRIDGRAGAVVDLAVENQGAIAPADLANLFDPFRAGPARHKASSGLGLGLYITREIAVGHGGEVRVSSSADGTSVVLSLPRVAAPLAPTES